MYTGRKIYPPAPIKICLSPKSEIAPLVNHPTGSPATSGAERDATRAHSQNLGSGRRKSDCTPINYQLRRAMRASRDDARSLGVRRQARISLVGGGAMPCQQQQAARLSLMRVPACADCYCLRCDVRGSCRRAESIAIPAGTGGRCGVCGNAVATHFPTLASDTGRLPPLGIKGGGPRHRHQSFD